MEKTCKIMFAEFPGDLVVRPQAAEWMRRTMIKCRPVEHLGGATIGGAWVERWRCDHPKISEIVTYRRSDTPIDMVRNHSVELAQQFGCDYLLMLDNDMEPDQSGPHAVIFWDVAFDWIFDRKEPALIFAPYLHGQSDYNNVCVFRWQSHNNNHYPFGLVQYSREEAAACSGIHRVAAGPTGVMLFDMRIFADLPKPYFQYEFEDDGAPCHVCHQPIAGPRCHKSSTEDCYFTRNVTLLYYDRPDAGCFCLWDSWAIHHKVCGIPRPEAVTNDQIGRSFHEALKKNRSSHEGLLEVKRTLPPATRPAADIECGNFVLGSPAVKATSEKPICATSCYPMLPLGGVTKPGDRGMDKLGVDLNAKTPKQARPWWKLL